jgi:hypothetical protein
VQAEARLAAGSAVSHTWTVHSRAPKPGVLPQVADLMNDFGGALNQGAFWDGAIAPPKCSTQVSTERGVECRYDLDGCDVRYARVLRNQLYAIELITETPLVVYARQLPVADDDLGLVVDATAVETSGFYPAPPARLPFEFLDSDADRQDQHRRVLIEFGFSLNALVNRALADVVRSWFRVAEFGYAPTEDAMLEGHFGISSIEADIFDDVTYEIVVETFRAPEFAWTSLLCMLAWMPPEFRCSRVTLE